MWKLTTASVILNFTILIKRTDNNNRQHPKGRLVNTSKVASTSKMFRFKAPTVIMYILVPNIKAIYITTNTSYVLSFVFVSDVSSFFVFRNILSKWWVHTLSIINAPKRLHKTSHLWKMKIANVIGLLWNKFSTNAALTWPSIRKSIAIVNNVVGQNPLSYRLIEVITIPIVSCIILL
jgi:hypothetical protein